MKRRKFLYWVGAGLFGIGETLRIDAFDRLAAATMNKGRSGATSPRSSTVNKVAEGPVVDVEDDPHYEGKVDPKRAARHGRPPSRWLRSLNAEELREWLKSVNPQEAGVSGMTYWTHLTRDHLFVAEMITGLTVDEQAKLHAAAHAGY